MDSRKKRGLLFSLIFLVIGLISLILYLPNPNFFFLKEATLIFIIIYSCMGVLLIFLTLFANSPSFDYPEWALTTTIVLFSIAGITCVIAFIVGLIFASLVVFIILQAGILFLSFAGVYLWTFLQKKSDAQK